MHVLFTVGSIVCLYFLVKVVVGMIYSWVQRNELKAQDFDIQPHPAGKHDPVEGGCRLQSYLFSKSCVQMSPPQASWQRTERFCASKILNPESFLGHESDCRQNNLMGRALPVR